VLKWNRATEVRVLAERQMGEFLKSMPKATGVRMAGGDETGSPVVTDGNRRETPTLADIGITKKQSSTAQKLADIPAQIENTTFAHPIGRNRGGFAQTTDYKSRPRAWTKLKSKNTLGPS
jgi:hypothetical protein